MAERFVRLRQPEPGDEIGFVVDEISPGVGEFVGVYAVNNNTRGTTYQLSVAVVGDETRSRRRLVADSRSTERRRVDVAARDRIPMRLDEEGEWEFPASPSLAITIHTEYARPRRLR